MRVLWANKPSRAGLGARARRERMTPEIKRHVLLAEAAFSKGDTGKGLGHLREVERLKGRA